MLDILSSISQFLYCDGFRNDDANIPVVFLDSYQQLRRPTGIIKFHLIASLSGEAQWLIAKAHVGAM